MRHCLELAEQAARAGEVPVGAVVVADEELLGEGFNAPIGTSDPTAHAEIRALRAAGGRLGVPRLVDTTLYVTLEPCLMCLGAMLHARVGRLVFGAPDTRVGATRIPGLIPDDRPGPNHRLRVEGGLLEDECAALLRAFFAAKRG
jgi:tRNA(adenine34) deaminase